MLLLLLLLLLGLTAATELPPGDPGMKLARGGCPPFWYNFNGRCYKYVATRLTWADAELNCVSQGANLVSIHSVQENNFVAYLIRNFDHQRGFTWIGLTDSHKEGAYTWSDGSAYKFGQWGPGEPNNLQRGEDCAHTNFCESNNPSKWNDAPCGETYASVCKHRFGWN